MLIFDVWRVFLDIIFSANNNEEVFILPVIEEIPELPLVYNNTVIDTINGQLNIIGNKALREVTLQGFFPVNKNYSFVRPGSNPDGWAYVAFFNKWSEKKVPIRMIWLEKEKKISNMAYTIENFTPRIKRNKDIAYTLTLKEYRFVEVKRV